MQKSILYTLMTSASLFSQTIQEDLLNELSRQQKVIDRLSYEIQMLKKKENKPHPPKLHEHRNEKKHTEEKNDKLDIALVANMSIVARNIENSLYANYSIPGFVESAGEIPFDKNRGFNLNYAELEFESELQPSTEFYSSLHIEKEELHIDELFIRSEILNEGTYIRAGRFRSGFSRQNVLHQHGWDFSAIPLVYEAFFGPTGLTDTGLQIQIDERNSPLTLIGVEALQGENERSFGDTEKNGLYIGYLKQEFSVSHNTSLLLGATLMHGRNTEGRTDIYGAETRVSIKTDKGVIEWESEMLYRNLNDEKRAGLYTQAVYRASRWGGGVRYDTLFKNGASKPENLDRFTAMIMYRPFAFAKLHLQYSYDRSKQIGTEQKRIGEILLGLTIETGGHEAHTGHSH